MAAPAQETPAEIQTKLDFIASHPLGVRVSSTHVTPGLYVPKEAAHTDLGAPTLTLPGASSSKTYIAMSVDPDAPAQYGTILHWVQSDMRADADGVLASTAPFIADWRGPRPPAGHPPHRYIFLVYEQPAGFDAAKYAPAGGEKMPLEQRINFKLEVWEKELGLGPALAGNYFVTSD